MTVTHTAPPKITGRLDPEDGPLARRIFQSIGQDGTRAIIGFASEAGVRRNKGRVGAKDAPDAIRRALGGLAAPLGFEPVADLGNIAVEGDALEDGQALLSETVAQALRQYERVIVIGGGHETAYGSWLGLHTAYPDAKIGIINFDAHLDLRNIGEAGASSGTPFNQIRHANPHNFDYLCVGVARESNTQALFDRAKDWGVRIVFDQDLTSDLDAAKTEIDALVNRSDVIYLTIDIDVLPHYQAPGVSAPAARGVSFSILEALIAHLQTCCRIHSKALPLADIVEVSPPHDKDNMTAKSAAILALKLLSSD